MSLTPRSVPKLALMLSFVLLWCTGFAQNINTYTFTPSTIGVASPSNLTLSNSSYDDNNFALVTMPFSFTYAGLSYSTVGISANGYIKLGGTTSTSYSVLTSTQTNIISGFNADLYALSTTVDHDISWGVKGSVGSRVFIVQWTNWGFYSSGLNEFNFQIQLYEGSNQIKIVYGNCPGTTSKTIQVGLKGSVSTDFQALSSVTDWVSAVPSTTINSSNIPFNSTVKPASGLTYTFSAAATAAAMPFTVSTGTYLGIGGGTSLVSNLNTTVDDTNYPLMSLPFSFTYHGVSYSTIGISANGYVKLGGTTGTSYSNVLGSQIDIISAFNGDLYGRTINGGDISYNTIGTSPSRTFILQWKNWGFYSSGNNEATFQIRLLESNSSIQFVYGNCPAISSYTTYVGINGSTTTDFNARTNSTTGSWGTTTAATATSNPMNFSSANKPALGQVFTFAPPTSFPCTGTPAPGNTLASTGSACPSTAFTLSLSTNFTTVSNLVFQWQSGPTASGPWTNFGTNAATQSVSLTSSTYYRCNVTCTGSGLAAASVPVLVSVNSFLNCYCTSNANSTFDEEITNVTFATMNNSSSCGTLAPGPGSIAYMYSNYKTSVTPPSVTQFSPYTISVTQTSCNGQYNNTTAVYIDYNQNGLFTDPGETVFTGPYTYGNHTATGIITIPLSATPGQTVMRVVNVESSVVSPCGIYSWGETEDYLINIVAAPLCTSPPNPGTATIASASVCSGSTTTISASGFSTGIGISFQWESATSAGGPFTAVAGLTSPLATTPAITGPTYFRMAVTCSGNTQYTNTVSVVTDFTNCYCTSSASSTADEEIYSVTVNGSTNALACGVTAPGAGSLAYRYSNFRPNGSLVSMQQLQNVPFVVEENECDGATYYPFGTAIFIDYNQNGSFADAGEQVFVENATAYGPRNVTGSFTVPLTALPGVTGMRIIVAEGYSGSGLTPCLAYGYGETEDYLVTITPAPPCTGTPNVPVATADPALPCSSQPQANLVLTGYNTANTVGVTHQWMSSTTSGGPYTAIPGATSVNYTATGLTGTTYFVCQETCSFSGLSSVSNETSTTVVDPQIVSTNGATRCGSGTAVISATSSAMSSVEWYASATGGASIGSGNSLTTPFVNSTTTFYAEATIGAPPVYTGVASNAVGFSSSLTGSYYNVFDVLSPVTLESFVIYPWAAGNAVIQHSTSAGVILNSITVPVTAAQVGTPVTVVVNWSLNPANGTAQRIGNITGVASVAMSYTYSGVAMPYTVPGKLNIYNTNIGNTYWFYAYNWKLFTGCKGPRVPVTVDVTPAPAISVTATSAIVCSGNQVTLSVTSPNDPNYTYSWTSSASGFTATGATATLNPTVSSTYSVYAVDNTSGAYAGCGNVGSVTVNTTTNNLAIGTTLTPSSGVCPGYDAQLNASATEGNYCLPTYSFDCSSADYIANVNFSGINNTTACSGGGVNNFVYYSALNANVTAGVTYPMSVTISPSWSQGISVWIDFNKNQTYEASELVYSNYVGSTGYVYGFNVTVPATALNGATRMRVRCAYASIPTDPCANYSFGDCEDYPVTISGGVPAPAAGFSYVWTGGSNLSATNIANPVAQTMASTTTYTVTVTSGATGCTKSQNVTVNVKPVPSVYSQPIDAACEGSSMTVTANDFSAAPAVSFAWSHPNGFSATTSINNNPVAITSQGVIGTHDGMYRVVGTNSVGCTDTSYTNWILNPNPVPYLVTGSLDSVSCPNLYDGGFNIGVNSGTPFPPTAQANPWNMSSVSNLMSTITSGSSPNSPTLGTFINLPEDNYQIFVGDFNSCQGDITIFLPTEVNEAPEWVAGTLPASFTVSNTTGLCTAVPTWTPPSWTDDCSGTSMAQTGGFALGQAFPVGNTTVTYTVTDAQGATAVHSFVVTVEDTEDPSLISAPPAYSEQCNPVSWTPPVFSDNCAGMVVTSSQPLLNPSSSILPAGLNTITYTATDYSGNVTSYSFTIKRLTESVAADTVVSNRNFHNICIGENITMTVTGGSLGDGANWNWYTNATGTGTPVYTGAVYTAQPTSTTTYYVRAEGTCNTTAMEAITVNVSTSGPGTVSIISTPPVGAVGQSGTLTVAPAVGAQYYQYTSNLGHISAVLFNGQIGPYLTPSTSVNVTFQQSLQNYQIRVIALNACGRSQTASTTIRGTVAQGTDISSANNNVACDGQTITYTGDPIVGSNTYTWSISPASAGTIVSGQGGLTIQVLWTNLSAGPASLCYNGQTTFNLAGPVYCETISTNAPVPGTITGPLDPCQGSTQTYSIVAVPGATAYTWSTPGIATSIVSSGTSASITFPGSAFSGNVAVTATVSCGAGSVTSAPSLLAVASGIPGVPGSISGPTSGVCNVNGLQYSLATSDANDYIWTTSDPSITVASGNGSNSVLVNFAAAALNTGTITVEAVYACGSVFESINVERTPGPVDVLPADICDGQPAQYTATATGATGFSWTVGGQLYDYPLNATQSLYYVQWDYSWSNGGYFALEVAAYNGCGTGAVPFAQYGANCRLAEETFDAEVYPNPTTGVAAIDFVSRTESDYSLKVTDLAGRVIISKDVAATKGNNQIVIDLSVAGKGMYLINLTAQDGTRITKRLAVE